MNVDEIAKNFTGQSGLAYGIDTAVKSLRPGAKFELSAGGGEFSFPKWDDPSGKPPPTKKAIMAEFERQKAMAKYYQYAYDRCHDYPDGFEQLDMLWHAINEGIPLKKSEWFKSIDEVKKKHPKPKGEPPSSEPIED